MIQNIITFRIFSQSLLLIVLALSGFSVFAQQPIYFQKPDALSNCNTADKVQERILYEYGAVYLSRDAILPAKCLLTESEVNTFFGNFNKTANRLSDDGFGNDLGEFYLQTEAKKSLLKVFAEIGGYKFIARNWNKTTTNNKSKKKDLNDDWAQRTFFQTKCNWLGLGKPDKIEVCKRTNLGQISADSLEIKSMPRMFKVAIPGSSQHHLGLAIDVNDKTNADGLVCGDFCVSTLEKNGWYRTVRFDRFHYTYLGYPESELPSKGLKKVACSDTFTYWVPKVEDYEGYTNWRCK